MKKIEDLKINLLTYRQDRINRGDLKALAENIKTYGLQHPLLVTGKNGKFEIVDGRRRLEAILLNGAQTAPCIVLTEQEANEDLSLILNTHRLNLGPVELYKMAARYVKDELKGDPLALPPEKIRAVAAKLNLDINAACRILNIGRLDKETRDLLASGKLPLRLALLTTRILDQKNRQLFCKLCIEERPSMREALEMISWRVKHAPCLDLFNDALFDTEECQKCRHRGHRDQSLFEESVPEDDDENFADSCWNKKCYEQKTKDAYNELINEAKTKLKLTGVSKVEKPFDSVRFSDVTATDSKKCEKCNQVKVAPQYGGKLTVCCPVSCANIKQAKESSGRATKPAKKDPSKFNKEDKIQILNVRFAVAARKAMLEHFIIVTKEKISNNNELTYYKFRKKPTNYKRILFFIGFDKSESPFNRLHIWPSNFIDGRFVDKEQRDCAKIIKTLDLKKLAQLNIEIAAEHLSSLDRSGVTPERINVAIQVLFGIPNWCRDHYDDIFAKLSKRSKTFLSDIKPWKPAWTKATKKKK